MRKIATILGLLILSGCSSGGPDQLILAARDEILGRNAPEEPATPLTRARIEATGLSLLRVSVRETGQNHVLVASQLRKGGVTYLGPDQKTIVMRGGLVSVTRGLGFDMAPLTISANDPVAKIRPLATWPKRFTRTYQLEGRGVQGARVAVTCSSNVGDATQIVIAELRHSVRKVTETCVGADDVAFENVHMVAPSSGFIWQSSQWTGPLQGQVQYEVLEPLE